MVSNPSASLPPWARPLVGGDPAEIGGHRLVGRLGGSTMGVVYAAVSPDEEPVALRVAHSEWTPAEDPDRRVTLVRGDLGVCAVGATASGTHHGRPWTSVPFLPGPDLALYVRENGPLPEPALLVLAAGTAEALASIHATGMAHGDVKPGNVIMTPDGPRLVDHGIARQIDDGDSLTTAGSVGWLAPERYAGTLPDTASDLFSWACVVVLAATGREPFGQDASPPEAARRAAEETVDMNAVPEELRSLLGRALSTDPARRPPAEEAYLECLLLAGVEDSATPDMWAERLRSLVRAHWPHVETDRPGAAAHEAGAPPAQEGGQEAGAGRGGGSRALGRGPGHARRARNGEPRAVRGLPVLLAAGAVFLAAAIGGGYLLLNSLAGESDTTTATSDSQDQEAPPLSGMDLVSASLDTLVNAQTFELTLVTHQGDGQGYGQPLPSGAPPTMFDRVLYQAGPPEALRWSSTVSGGRTSDLMAVDADLLRAENSAWNGQPTWYEAEPELSAEAFTPERIVEPLARAAEEGTVTAEEETVFTASPAPQDAYGHLGGQLPDGVPAIRVDGEFPAPEAAPGASTSFTLVATEDGSPLAFAVEGLGGGDLGGRPVSEGVPTSFLDPVSAQEQLWYTQYTFVEVDGGVDLGVPAPEQVQPMDAGPGPQDPAFGY